MYRTPVSSSNLKSVGYSRASRILEVEFLSGSIYQYQDVPRSVADGFRKAESKGRYLNTRIKGKYKSECVHKVVKLHPSTEPDPDPEPGSGLVQTSACASS